jgi:hypothetical protein
MSRSHERNISGSLTILSFDGHRDRTDANLISDLDALQLGRPLPFAQGIADAGVQATWNPPCQLQLLHFLKLTLQEGNFFRI